MSNLVDIEPCLRARRLRIGIAAIVIAVIVSMWAEVTISITQSRVAALKNMELTAANLAFAFDEEVTRTLGNIAGTIDAVANRMRDQESDTNIYSLSRQFPIVAGPISSVGVVTPNGILIGDT